MKIADVAAFAAVILCAWTDEARAQGSNGAVAPDRPEEGAFPSTCSVAPVNDVVEPVQRASNSGQKEIAGSVVPYMRVTIAAHCDWKEYGSRFGGYTRLFLRYTPPSGNSGTSRNDRSYDGERRAWPARWLMGKSVARVLTIKATLARPKVAMTASLASVGHVSNDKDGESWTTELNARRMLTPYFRVDPESVLNLEFTLNVSSTYDAAVARNGLALVRRATELVAPSATLLTSLNGERFGQASQFVDSSISSLLRESIVERSINDYAVKDWVGQALADIKVLLPMRNDVTPKGVGEHLRDIGTWTVYASEPILSVFSDAPLFEPKPSAPPAKAATTAAAAVEKELQPCASLAGSERQTCRDFAKLQPAAVLNFEVDSGVSVNQALSGDERIVAARDVLMKTEKGAAGATAAIDAAAQDLCMIVANKAERLGFNRFDTSVILWAYTRQGFDAERGGRLREPSVCLPLALAHAGGLRREAY